MMSTITCLKSLRRGLICMLVSLLVIEAHAQLSVVNVSGSVKDSAGFPLAGATVLDPKSNTVCTTDSEGYFSIKVAPGTVLTVSFLGFVDEKVPVSSADKIYEVILEEDALSLQELVVVGYGEQKKATLTGSVASISNDEIVTTKNENVQNMLAGKVSGLRVRQNSSEPGQFNTSMDIRGFGAPLIVIDGVPRDNMARLNPEDIENISVLKDASAAIYGVKGGNGVILITTKRGNEGKVRINYSGNVTLQQPTNFPDLVSSADWLTLYNEKFNMHNVDATAPAPKYSQEEIDAYRSGEKPTYNWKDAVFGNVAPQTQHTISASGGNDRISFYTSIGYLYQDSFFKNNPIDYQKYTLRSNVSAKISENLSFDVNLSGHIDERNTVNFGSSDIIRSTWLFSPLDPFYLDDDPTRYHTKDDNPAVVNPLAMIDANLNGNQVLISRWFQSSFALKYNIPFVKGLYAKAFFSYDYIMNDNKFFVKAFDTYKADGNTSHFSQGLTEANYKVQRNYYGKNHRQWYAQLGYDRSFGEHAVSAMVLFEDQHKAGDNFWGSREVLLNMPEVFVGIDETQIFDQADGSGSLYDYAYQSLAGRLNYNYAGKYLAEFIFRYDGSSRFPAASRWGFFPSASLGWRVSDEGFWKNSKLNFIENFKLRTSYGVTGDDSGLNYEFLTGFNYPVSGNINGLPGGTILNGEFVNASNPKGLANGAITWYTTKIFDAGLDMSAWNGKLGLAFDYFVREREGLYATRQLSLPGSVGASLPRENLNGDQDKGFEIELSHRNKVGDFNYEVKGNVSYTRRKTLYYERAESTSSYLNWRQNNSFRYNNIWWGYGQAGRVTSWDQIYHNDVYIGRGTVLGDYLYDDWNGDGMISDLDVHPIAHNDVMPMLNFGLTLNAQWKGLDLSMLFQGAGNRYIIAREFLMEPLWATTNAISAHLDRWHPKDPSANPYNPATEWIEGVNGFTGTTPNANSEHALQNARYLRLKNLELGYSLPQSLLSKVKISKARVFVSAYNVFTLTGLQYLDPEFYIHPSSGGASNLGYFYPINKTYTFGVNLQF